MECAKGILEIMNPGGVHYDGEVAYACPVCGDAKRVYRRIVLGDVSGVLPCSYACRCEIEAEELSRRWEAARRAAELKRRAYRGSGVAEEFMKLTLDELDGGLREAAELVLKEYRSGYGVTLSCGSDQGRRIFSCAVTNVICEAGVAVSYVCVQAFLRAIKLTYNDPDGGESESSLLRDRLNASVLIVDGLGTCKSSPWSLGILDELVSGARRAGMALVATTPLESRELEQWLYDSCLGGVYDRLLQRSPFASVGTNNYEKAERVRSVARLIGA